MLGDSPSQVWNALFASKWTSPEIRAHGGYARDHFRQLLDRKTPPVALANVWRALESLTWLSWKIFLLERQLEEGVKI